MTTVRLRILTLGILCAAVAGLAACTGTGTDEKPVAPDTSPPVPATAALSTIDGTAFYYTRDSTAIQVWSLRHGTVARHHRIVLRANDMCVGNSIIVSPDGRWLAWVASNDDESGTLGTLFVSGLDGRNPHTLENVICNFDDLSWAPDGSRLAIEQVANDTGLKLYLDPRTGATRTRQETGAIWSANRAYRVHDTAPDRSGTFVVESANGAVVHTVEDYTNDYPGFDTCGYSLKGVSDDGRYVTIGWCASDPSRVLGAHYLFDTSTGKHVTLPVKRADAVVFLNAGTVLVRGQVSESRRRSLLLISTSGALASTTPEPAALPADAVFLTYVPG